MNKQVQFSISGYFTLQEIADIQVALKDVGHFNGKPIRIGSGDSDKAPTYRVSYSLYDYNEFKRRQRLQKGIEKEQVIPVKPLSMWQKICKFFKAS